MNWSNLSLQDKSAWMQFFIQNGITKLEEMGNMYDKQFGNRMDSRGNLFATGGSANPDYDPEHPYHYHNEDTNEKVVIEPETYEQWKDNPQFATIRAAVEAEQAAHPNPEYEVNPEYTEVLQKIYNTNVQPYPYWRMDALPEGWTTTRGIVFDNNGQPYLPSQYLTSDNIQHFEPIGDSASLPFSETYGVYNRDYYPVRIPERYIEKQPLPIDLQIDNNNVQQYVIPVESNTNESEEYPLGQLLMATTTRQTPSISSNSNNNAANVNINTNSSSNITNTHTSNKSYSTTNNTNNNTTNSNTTNANINTNNSTNTSNTNTSNKSHNTSNNSINNNNKIDFEYNQKNIGDELTLPPPPQEVNLLFANGGHLFQRGGYENNITLGFNANKTPSFGLTNPYDIDNSLYIASTGMTLPEVVVKDNMPDRLRNMSTAQRNAYTRHSVDRANIQQNVADRTNYEYLRPDNWLSFTPIIGDGIDAARSIVDINNGNVGMGLAGLGMLALPNIVEKPLKIVKNAVKDLNPIRNFRINRATDHSDIFKAIADDYNYRALKSDTPQNITETRHNRANMSAIAKNNIAPFLIEVPIPTLDKSLFPKDFSLGHYLSANAVYTPATNTVSVNPLSWIMPPSKFRGLMSHEGTHWAHGKLDPDLRLSMWDIESGTPKYYTINNDNSVMQKYLPMFNNYDGLWIGSPEEVAADMMKYKYGLYHKNPSEFSVVSDAFKSNFNDWPLERRANANNILSERFAQEPEDMMDFLTTLSSKGYFKDGGPIVTPYGQWQYQGAVTRIPSNNITMKGVNYPVLGISNTGDTKMMMPNANYVFMGDYVDEYPMFGKGGHLFQGNGNSQLQLGFGVNPNTQWRWMGNIERTSGNQTPVVRYTAPEVPGFLPTTSSTVTYSLEDEITKKQAVAAARKAAEINARNNSGRAVISQDNDPRSYAQRNLDRNAQDIVDASVFQVASPGNVDLNTVYTGITSALQMGIAPELAHQALVRPIATGLSMAAAVGGNKLIDTFTPYSSWGNMVSKGLLGTDNKGVEFVSEFTNPLAWASGIYGNGVETRLGELMIRRGDSLQGAVLVKPQSNINILY